MTNPVPSALVVLHPFGKYNRGDLINDPETVSAILRGGNNSMVVASTPPATGASSSSAKEHI